MTIHEILRTRILRRCGLIPHPDLSEIERTEWDPGFERHMRVHLAMGGYRYGLLRDPANPRYASVTSAIERLERYRRDGNREHLIDAANLCLVEWVRGGLGAGEHPSPSWSPVDDGAHTAPLGDDSADVSTVGAARDGGS